MNIRENINKQFSLSTASKLAASAFIGTWTQEIGLITALITCGIAIKQSRNTKA